MTVPGNAATSTGPIRVLHVDDEPGFADVTTTLERTSDRIEAVPATAVSEGVDLLAGGEFDCVVSDYEIHHTGSLEFLAPVRAEYPDLPFILFTGKGSESTASEAISAGVTLSARTGGSAAGTTGSRRWPGTTRSKPPG